MSLTIYLTRLAVLVSATIAFAYVDLAPPIRAMCIALVVCGYLESER